MVQRVKVWAKALLLLEKKYFILFFFNFNIFLDAALNFQMSEYLQNLLLSIFLTILLKSS